MIQSKIALPETAARGVLQALGLTPNIKYGVAIVILQTNDKKYESLKHRLSELDIHYTEEIMPVFDEEEMENAEYYHLAPRVQGGYPEPQSDYAREAHDTSFACSDCGKGYVQNHPYALRVPPRFGKNDVMAMFWTYELLVTDRLRQLIEEAELSGTEFWPVLRYSGDAAYEPMGGIHQLFVSSTLPPMSKRTVFPLVDRLPSKKNPCSCGRLGRNIPVQLRYDRKNLDCAEDFNRTHEWLGGGLDTVPLKVVSRATYDLFIKHKIRGVDFEPVLIEG